MNGRPPLEGALEIVVTATFPVPASWPKSKLEAAFSGRLPHIKPPDCDNVLKNIDAMNEIVWVDDKQIVRATVSKRYGDRPLLRIEIAEVVS